MFYNDTRTVPGTFPAAISAFHISFPFLLQINNYRLTVYNHVYIGSGHNNPFFSFYGVGRVPFPVLLIIAFSPFIDTLLPL